MRAESAFWQALERSLPAGIAAVDLEGRQIYANSAFCVMLGWRERELLGAVPPFIYWPPEETHEIRRAFDASMRGEAPPEGFELRFCRRSGERFDVLIATSPLIDGDGNTTGWLASVLDITHRKRAEDARQRLAAIVESSDDAIISKTLDGIILSWNSGAERIYGYPSQEAIGRSMTLLLPPDRADEESAILGRLQRGERIDHFETVRMRKDGTLIHVSMTISPVRNEEGKITGVSHVARDITERKIFEEQLRETAKLESIGVLAGGVAHDFNNLLVGIMGNTSLVLETLAPADPNRPLIEAVLQAGERAADLTSQLLAYSGKGRFVIQVADLSELVRNIVSLVQTSVPKTIRLRLEFAGGLPPIEADVTQIQQLVMNLVINAAEAIGGRPGKVIVRTGLRYLEQQELRTEFTQSDLAPGAYTYLEVEDDGAGMDESTKARIFEPFFTTKFTGRGLGLAAALGIVRGHKGAIRVNSRPGDGSTFTVLFPAASGRPLSVGAEPHEDLSGCGVVLVVDDEGVVQRTSKLTLERFGYEVLVAADGQEAIDVFRREAHRISAVLLDLTMPVMSGEETLKHLREIRGDIPVILSSGFNEAEAVRRFEGQGLSGFLQKPYTSERLARKIKAVCTSAGNARTDKARG